MSHGGTTIRHRLGKQGKTDKPHGLKTTGHTTAFSQHHSKLRQPASRPDRGRCPRESVGWEPSCTSPQRASSNPRRDARPPRLGETGRRGAWNRCWARPGEAAEVRASVYPRTATSDNHRICHRARRFVNLSQLGRTCSPKLRPQGACKTMSPTRWESPGSENNPSSEARRAAQLGASPYGCPTGPFL